MNHFQKIFNQTKPVIIAGPCSAESEKQVLEIAHQLKKHDNLILEQVFGNRELDQIVLKALV